MPRRPGAGSVNTSGITKPTVMLNTNQRNAIMKQVKQNTETHLKTHSSLNAQKHLQIFQKAKNNIIGASTAPVLVATRALPTAASTILHAISKLKKKGATPVTGATPVAVAARPVAARATPKLLPKPATPVAVVAKPPPPPVLDKTNAAAIVLAQIEAAAAAAKLERSSTSVARPRTGSANPLLPPPVALPTVVGTGTPPPPPSPPPPPPPPLSGGPPPLARTRTSSGSPRGQLLQDIKDGVGTLKKPDFKNKNKKKTTGIQGNLISNKMILRREAINPIQNDQNTNEWSNNSNAGGGMRKHKQTFKGYSKYKSNLKRTKKKNVYKK